MSALSCKLLTHTSTHHRHFPQPLQFSELSVHLDTVSTVPSEVHQFSKRQQLLFNTLSCRYPTTQKLLENALGRYGPVESQARMQSAQIQSSSGEPFYVFAKSSTGRGGEAVRMWEDIIEPKLHFGMLIQASFYIVQGTT